MLRSKLFLVSLLRPQHSGSSAIFLCVLLIEWSDLDKEILWALSYSGFC